jgi:hypothetical protein
MGSLIFDRQFAEQVQKDLADFLIHPELYEDYTFEFPNGLNEPSVRDIGRVLHDGESFENKEYLTKCCIKNKIVIIKQSGKQICSFSMAKIDDSWDVFPIKDYPIALNLLLDTCMSHLLKKSLLPLISTNQKVEEKTQEK